MIEEQGNLSITMQGNIKMNHFTNQYQILDTYSEYHMKSENLNSKTKSSFVNYIKENFEEREHHERTRNILDTQKVDKNISENIKEKQRLYTLQDIANEKRNGDLYIVNTDHELTETIVNTFKKHNCEVTVSQLEVDLMALFVLLDRKINIKKLRKLIERSGKFGLEFFVTKTGMTTALMYKIKDLFRN